MVRSHTSPAKRLENESRRKRYAFGGVGRALHNDIAEKHTTAKRANAKMVGVADSQIARSVLEQTSLDEFISSAALSRAQFDGTRGNHLNVVDCSATLVSAGPSPLSNADKERLANALRVQVPIPRRPLWHEGISPNELAGLEGESFLNWRRGLARIEEGEGLIMTPYERNLDFWRQLWRCVEKSDLLVQILDARDPEFYRCHDLERYVAEWESKRTLLLINKADFLTPEVRRRWSAHFSAAGVDHIFFSALRELHKQHKLPTASNSVATTASEAGADVEQKDQVLPPHGPLVREEDDDEVLNCDRLMEELLLRMPREDEGSDDDQEKDNQTVSSRVGTMGFVGYPNVGKSSVINALFGAKKVSMSRTPGKTKHLQTLEIPGIGITLCDCPGLVFPSVVATKAHLVINGTIPLTELKECQAPARLVVEKIGLSELQEKYGITAAHLKDGAERLGDAALASTDETRAFLAALAVVRQHFLRHHVPDEGWSARRLLREYVTGELLYCESPLGFSPPPRGGGQADAAPANAAEEAPPSQLEPAPAASSSKVPAEASDSDFSDLEDFLNERAGGQKKDTKKKVRQQNKRTQKKGPSLADVHT